MSRLPRLYIPGLPQLILQRGNNRQNVFKDDEDYTQYLHHLRESARESNVVIHAYVLMPDHIHILAMPVDEKGVGGMMQRLGRRYVRYFNDKYARMGTIWEGRYRATVVEVCAYLLDCYTYIEHNPTRAGLVQDPSHYLWSSCRHHLGLTTDALITDPALFWALGNTPFERQVSYRNQLEQGVSSKKLEAIRYASHHGWILGELPSASSSSSAHSMTPNRRAQPLARGRPRLKK